MSQLVFDSPKYKSWKRNIESHGITLDQIEVIGEISRNGTSLFTALLDCQLTTLEGITMPRSVVLRGDGAIVIPVLNCVEDQTVYTLMVEQRRVVDGSFSQLERWNPQLKSHLPWPFKSWKKNWEYKFLQRSFNCCTHILLKRIQVF